MVAIDKCTEEEKLAIMKKNKSISNCAECHFAEYNEEYVYCSRTKSKIGTTVACYEKMKNCPI